MQIIFLNNKQTTTMILECANQSAIIGVSGTLLGVMLGFILNQVVKMGKIKVFVNNINHTILNRDENGDPYKTNAIGQDSESVTINLNLDFYNTSSFKQKIGRDFYIIFRTPKGNIKLEINDIRFNRFKIINLKPNELVNHDLRVYLNSELEIYKDFDFYLEYKNSNNCTIRKKIILKDYNEQHERRTVTTKE